MMETIDSQQQETPKKRPMFLTVLCVLSFISLASSGLTTLSALTSQPMTADEVEAYEAEQYENIATFKEQDLEGLETMLVSMMELTIYQNNEVYYSYQFFNLITILLGFAGVYLMFKLKKIGFHLYVLYSLIPILGFYIFFPIAIVPTFLVVGSTVIAALFAILYGMNLKHMD